MVDWLLRGLMLSIVLIPKSNFIQSWLRSLFGDKIVSFLRYFILR